MILKLVHPVNRLNVHISTDVNWVEVNPADCTEVKDIPKNSAIFLAEKLEHIPEKLVEYVSGRGVNDYRSVRSYITTNWDIFIMDNDGNTLDCVTYHEPPVSVSYT